MESVRWYVQWHHPTADWYWYSSAGPFDTEEEAVIASREGREGVPRVYSTEDGREARELMQELLNA